MKYVAEDLKIDQSDNVSSSPKYKFVNAGTRTTAWRPAHEAHVYTSTIAYGVP